MELVFIIGGGVVILVLVLLVLFSSSNSKTRSDGDNSSSRDLWEELRSIWGKNDKGLYTSGGSNTGEFYLDSTSGAYARKHKGDLECDYCACPVDCDGNPRRIDNGCPAQQFECQPQDCSPVPNCLRRKSTYIPEPYSKN